MRLFLLGLLVCLSGGTASMAKAAPAFATFTTLASRQRINVPASSSVLMRRSSSLLLPLQLQPSPVEVLNVMFDDDSQKMCVFVKRDDKLDLMGAGIYGNKARKLWALASSSSSSSAPFPSVCVSWGGPQSNALLALAGLVCGVWEKKLVYYTKSIPEWLKARPLGNYQRALELGVDFRELPAAEYRALFSTESEGGGGGARRGAVERREGGGGKERTMTLTVSLKDLLISQEDGSNEERGEEGHDVLLVPQGAAFQGAEEGLRLLAVEIKDWWGLEKSKMEAGMANGASLAVVLPAGTGTTALYLAKHLRRMARENGQGNGEIMVYAVPCVGDGEYLKSQMARLSSSGGREGGNMEEEDYVPHVLEGSVPHVFGKPEHGLLVIWQELKEEHGLELDLLYGPHAWRAMRENWGVLAARHRSVLYIHTGGMEGLASQLARYRRLGMLK
ncbi:1-aminocyclopropane-1-carboxylate deaminase [Nannochloropsis oceanica]